MRTILNPVPSKGHQFDKAVSMASVTLELRVIDQLKAKYGVRFLPRQVIRRALNEGVNPFRL